MKALLIFLFVCTALGIIDSLRELASGTYPRVSKFSRQQDAVMLSVLIVFFCWVGWLLWK